MNNLSYCVACRAKTNSINESTTEKNQSKNKKNHTNNKRAMCYLQQK